MTDFEIVSGFEANGSKSTNTIVLNTNESIDCPFCHKGIVTKPLSFMRFAVDVVHIFLMCKSCKNTFIGYTRQTRPNQYHISKLSKGTHKTTPFSKEITEISDSFVKIFGQSEFAEQENLLEICGVGYRKALEFLIKDYLIIITSGEEGEIKKKSLGKCIEEHIDNPLIKSAAKAATWLGNDETHYVKKWEDKDLGDLKNLISITLHFISMELLSKKYSTEMGIENPRAPVK